jgi:hypothetical protein
VKYAQKSNRYLHHLVLEAFVGPRPPGMQCRHINGDSLDNRLENLAWGTASEDNYDRVRNGTHQHSGRTECLYGHPLDGVRLRKDGSVIQRFCKTCERINQKKQKARVKKLKTSCPQGHPFDAVRYRNMKDGSVIEQRYCTVCAKDQLDRGRKLTNDLAKGRICCLNCGGELTWRKDGSRRHCPPCNQKSINASKRRSRAAAK